MTAMTSIDPTELRRTAGSEMFRLRIVCATLAAAPVLYAGLATYVNRRFGPLIADDGTAAEALPWVLLTVGLALLVAAPKAARAVFMQARRRDATSDPESLTQAYLQGTILAFAVRESTAVLGLLAALVTGEPLWAWTAAALTVAAMALGWPRWGALEASLRR